MFVNNEEVNLFEELSTEEECYECNAIELLKDKENEYYYGFDSSIKRVQIKKRRDLFK